MATTRGDIRSGRRPEPSNRKAAPLLGARHPTALPVEPLHPNAQHLTSPAHREPLPREHNMVDPMRRPLDYILPLAEDDDLQDVLPERWHGRSHRSHRRASATPLAAFEVLEAQLNDEPLAEQRMTEDGVGSDSSSNRSEAEAGDDALLVLEELVAFGDRVAKVRRRATADAAPTDSRTNGGMQPPQSTHGATPPSWVLQQQALMPEQEAAKLLSYSLSQPHIRAMAHAALQQRKAPSPPAVVQQPPMRKASPPSLPHDATPATATSAAIDVASGISTMLTQQITEQQLVLQRLLTEHHKAQQAQFAEHRAEMARAQTEASTKADAFVKREVSSLKRQQAELVRRVGDATEGEGPNAARIPLDARPHRHGVVSGDITVHAANVRRGEALPDAPQATSGVMRNMPQETAALVANALQVERRKMEEERRQWQAALKQVQGDAAGHEKALLQQIKLLSERQEAITKASTVAALDKVRHANELHAHQVDKLLASQQRQQIRVLREDVLRGGGGGNNHNTTAAAGSQTHRHHHHQSNAVAAELRESIAQRKALTVSTSVDTADLQPAAVVIESTTIAPVPLSADPQAGVVVAGGTATPAALQSTSGGTAESLLEGTSSLNHTRTAPLRRPKPGRVILPSSNPGYHLQRTEQQTTGSTHADDDESDGAQDVPRDRVREFVGDAVTALAEGGAVAGPLAAVAPAGSGNALPVVMVLADPRDTRNNNGANDPTPPPAQCVEMCVSTLLSEQRTAELMGSATAERHAEGRKREPARYLNREEAQLLIDARKRLERIRQFSVTPSTLSDQDDPNVVHCIIGEPAESLLLNAITSKLIHEVIAENVRGFLRQVEEQLPEYGNGSAPTSMDVAHVLGFGSTGSQALDRELLEECLRECMNIVPTTTRRYPQLGQTERQGRESSPAVVNALPHARQVVLAEEMLWQEWVLARSIAATSGLDQHAPTHHEHVRAGPEDPAKPKWLEPTSAETAATGASPATSMVYQPPAVHVHVDTSSLADLVRQLVVRREEPIASVTPALPLCGAVTTMPVSRTLREEAQRHQDVDELLPADPQPPLSGVATQQNPVGSAPGPYYCAPPAQLSFDDMEAMLADRILRRIGPLLFPGAPVRPNDISGVSSATTTDTSSSSSSSNETPRICLVSPELQALQSAEAMQRYRYCGDVDNVMQFLMRAFVEEAPTPAAATAVASQQPQQESATFQTAVAAHAPMAPAAAPQPVAPPATVPPATTKDPVTNFLVDWFKNVDQDRRVQQTAEVQRVAEERRVLAISPPSSMISSTHPSSFGADGMHQFLRYLPADYVAGISQRPSATRALRTADDTVTTVTTLYETATSVTSSPASSRDDVGAWHARPRSLVHGAAHRPHTHRRGYDEGDAASCTSSSGTLTTISSISSAEMQSLLAQRAMQVALQWPHNGGGAGQQQACQPYASPVAIGCGPMTTA